MSDDLASRADAPLHRSLGFACMRAAWLAHERGRAGANRDLTLLGLRSIARGRALPLAGARAALGLPEDAFRDLIAALVARGLITLTPDGAAIDGAFGLTLVPTAHRLLLHRRDPDPAPRFTWCAFDAIGIPAAFAWHATAEGPCAGCGAPVRVEIRRGRVIAASHPDLRVVLLPPDPARPLCGAT